ncbi:glucosamine-6-phosphate deaminase [Priestia filamentosa]|uniref:glucosamine-6-phosphate deaminase n=1 Tax=Priestia filamentosa TaxID=1402861 RepID=UPI0005892426
MNIIEVLNYEEMSTRAFKLIRERLQSNPALKLGLATGSTPIGTYKALIQSYEEGEISFEKVLSFNLDEYVGLEVTDVNSYRYFMEENLFKHIDIKKENTFVPTGKAKDFVKECAAYEELIAKSGGVDVQILGIGSNGHIGFNEPETSFNSLTHVVDLDKRTIEANSRFFHSINEVPNQAVTMGIGTIMKSKEIILLISGDNKNEAINQLLSGEITETFPASVLHQHPNVTVIINQESYLT